MGFDFHREKAAGEAASLSQSLNDQLTNFRGFGGLRQGFGGKFAFEGASQKGDARQMLPQAIMEVLADPHLLAIGGFGDLTFEFVTVGDIADNGNDFERATAGEFGLEFATAAEDIIRAGEGLRDPGAKGFLDVIQRLLTDGHR